MEGVNVVKLETSVMIDRPAEEVWKFITDMPNSTKWDKYCLEAKQTSPGPLSVGTTFQLRRSRTPKNPTLRVTEYEPTARKLAFEFTSGPVNGTKQQFSVETIEGKIRLTRTIDVKYAGFYKLIGPLATGMMRREAEADLGNIKRAVESAAQP